MTTDEIQELKRLLVDAFADTGVVDDLPDDKTRDDFVLRGARELFLENGALSCAVMLRTPGGLTITELNVPYEQAHMRPLIIRAAAKFFQATQLYVVSETWVVTEDRKIPGLEPRHHEKRTEAVVVWSENPLRVPPMRTWRAEISRDAEGRPSLGEWVPIKSLGGRLTYLLPPEAYVAAGQQVPKA